MPYGSTVKDVFDLDLCYGEDLKEMMGLKGVIELLMKDVFDFLDKVHLIRCTKTCGVSIEGQSLYNTTKM